MGSSVKRLSLQVMVCALAVAVMGVLGWGVSLYANHGSIGFWWGMSGTANDVYLDGSNRMFQKGGWHLGNGTRTWGETYGLKAGRFYLTMGVTHTNPSITPDEANE
jgi:hypothetical protein